MILKTAKCGTQYYTDGRPELSCHEVYGEDYKAFLKDFIPYLEAKPESEWIEIIFANKDTSKRCVIYHFLGFVGQDYLGAQAGNNLDWYESLICAISRAGCRINDNNDPDYKQATSKLRSIAYLKNLLAGKELNPLQHLARFMQDRENICGVA